MHIDTLRNHILEDILVDPALQIGDDQDLLLSGLLDSISVIRLASFMEQKFSIAIPPEDLILEHFGTLHQLNTYLLSRL